MSLKYKEGSYRKTCPICGIDYHNTDMKKSYDNLYICPKCYIWRGKKNINENRNKIVIEKNIED